MPHFELWSTLMKSCSTLMKLRSTFTNLCSTAINLCSIIMKILLRVYFFLFFADLALAQTSFLTGSTSYQTLESAHIRLRYPTEQDVEARLFLGKAEAYVTHLEQEIHFSYQRKIIVYLTDRRFENAYVTGGSVGTDFHIVLPIRLLIPDLYFSGMDGSAFEVFVHEVTHHAQAEMGRYAFSKFFGPIYPYDFFSTPSWVWEGYAVYMESKQLPFRGRLKSSLNDALLFSALENGRTIKSFDFYRGNKDWAYSGAAQYLLGSEFMSYLAKTYGEEALHSFVYRTSQYTIRSDFSVNFGKFFDELLNDFNKELGEIPKRPRPSEQQILSDLKSSKIYSLSAFSSGDIAFIGVSETDEAKIYFLDSQGKVKKSWPWSDVFRDFLHPHLQVPADARSLADNHSIAFLAYASSLDKIAVNGVLARFDLESGELNILKSFPNAVAADFSLDGELAWVVSPKGQSFELSEVNLLSGESKILASLNGFSQISSIRVSPDQKFAALSAYGENTWDIYSLSLETAKVVRLVNSPAQELTPRWDSTGKFLYFLSDLTGTFNVAKLAFNPLKTNSSEICFASRVPWLTNQFAVDDSSALIVANRYERFFSLDKISKYENCQKIAALSKVVGKEQEPRNVSELNAYDESAWKTFIPVTRFVLPYSSTKDGSGLMAIIAGESPYKKVLWQSSFVYETPETDRSYGSLLISAYNLSPFLFGLGVESTQGYLYSSAPKIRDPRYTTETFTAALPLYSHTLYSSFSERQSRGMQNQGGFSLTHEFDSETETIKSAGPRRGLILRNHFAFFPESMNNEVNLQLQRFDQALYIPFTLDATHSLEITGTELFIQDSTNYYQALITGLRLAKGLGPNRSILSLDNTRSDARIGLKGFSDFSFWGSNALAASVSYMIPVYKADVGAMHVFDRLWFNPRLNSIRIGPFWNGAKFIGSRANTDLWHSAAGVDLKFQFSVIDFLPFGLEAYSARRISDDNKWEHEVFAFLQLEL